jgi:uronate dehydrogenase
MRVLITGAAGYVGQRLSQALAAEHDLRLGDVVIPANTPPWIHLDVTKADEVAAAMVNVDAVIHLAVASGHEGEFEEAAFNQQRFDVNIKGTWNVLEAARQAGVRRLAFTSSLMVVWGYPVGQWVASDAPARPVGTYAVTKHLCEILCWHYSESFGMSILCLRIPKPIDLDDLKWKQRLLRPQWLAFPDLIQAYRRALLAPEIGFEIITVVGESSRRRWDLSKAERLLGYQPTIRLEEMGYQFGEE